MYTIQSTLHIEMERDKLHDLANLHGMILSIFSDNKNLENNIVGMIKNYLI